ncbi:MAG TPA: hypothetical protein VLW45_00435 [Pelomicrobium sp.]|nr:hypothetical protein [Pelomicrobium sp.]
MRRWASAHRANLRGGWYKQYPVKSQYSAARCEELLRQGVTIDYSE